MAGCGSEGNGLRRSRARRLAVGLGLALTTTLVVALGVELGLRARGYGRAPAQYFDPAVGYRFLPSQTRTMLAGKTDVRQVEINELGYRGPAWSGEKPAGERRVACLGDSFTFGWGVHLGDTWPAKLQALLDGAEPEGRWSVASFAVPGYNTWNELQTYRRIVRPYRPDVVILQHFLNDLEPAAVGPRHTDLLLMRWLGRTALMAAFHRHLRTRIPFFDSGASAEVRALHAEFADNAERIKFDPEHPISRPFWERSMADLAALASEVRGDGAAFLLVSFPSAQQVARAQRELDRGGTARTARTASSKAQARLEREARELAVPFVDLFPAFLELGEASAYHVDSSGHPSPEGYGRAATAILEALLALD